ncbi:NAD(P)/FAD-dependent oxidoreductase [Phenylobacterium sp.]|uniref:NAD(P)/FAD-dependent oxidoreductase n=1 Tax=Phenylobacterium sp. TaxID=1871053 RepID=UPI0025D7A5F8|nr:NAD(P)/FAD-dependent oxidoreductase [Phenylobacterium sp.]
MTQVRSRPPRVVIAGAGFAGMQAAKALAEAPVEVVVIDRQNHQSFQPLLYQVATAALTPADVAWPIRWMLRGQKNAQVYMAEAQGIDRARRRLITSGGDFAYDWLVLATGATHAYFGHEEWAAFAPGLKRLEDATEIRRRVLMAFEQAELADTDDERRDLTTFVIVGGGPTGVEMAGAISDIARQALPPDFRRIDPREARVILVEAGPRILSAFPEDLSDYARQALEKRGVKVRTGAAVTEIDASGVRIGEETLHAGAVVWAAGVAASAAGKWLDAEQDRAGRVLVSRDLSVPGAPEIFAIGDTALAKTEDGKPVPGLAPAAKQMGAYVGRVIAAQAAGTAPPEPFAYRHQGDLATIGRDAAIVKRNDMQLTGFVGWVFWSAIHIFFLIGTRNRIAVAFSWFWEYVTFGRRSRLITEPAAPGCFEPKSQGGRPTADRAAAATARRVWS